MDPRSIFRAISWLAVGFCLWEAPEARAQARPSPFIETRGEQRAPVAATPQDAGAAAGSPANLWAVIVGINKYDSRNVPRLYFAVNDARAIRDRIIPHAPASVIKQAYLEDAAATRLRILEALDALADAHPDDTVLIYLSMHGIADGHGKEAYLIAHDTDPWNFESTGVPIRLVLQKVGNTPAKRVFLMLDTCYSGSAVGAWGAHAKTFAFGPTTRRAAPLSPEIYAAVKAQRGHFVISASRPDETSLELETLGHGLFTYFLLEALEGGAARPDNRFVSITDLYDYVSHRVSLFAQSLNQKQTPMMYGNFDGPPPYVTVVRRATSLNSSEFERLVREARLSFESSRLIVNSSEQDRVELYVAGNLHESWKAASKQVRIPKEMFDRHGNEIAVTVRASRPGRKTEEQTFRLARGDERRVTIESSPPPPGRPLPQFFPPPAP